MTADSLAASPPVASSLVAGAIAILETREPGDKVAASHALAARWRAGELPYHVGDDPRPVPPPRPARPVRPELMFPRDMPKRRAGGEAASRIALLHAIAHIELNALDLAWDLVARFAGPPLPRELCDDWVQVADEEATHFALIAERLASLGAGYGDLPAHDGLWQAAETTSSDLLARLAVVPMVLEARGLDVTPPMIEKFRKAGDLETVAALEVIYRDEVGHVASGSRWFHHLCAESGLSPQDTWQAQVRTHFKGALKPPFNGEARDQAGLPEDFYLPIAN